MLIWRVVGGCYLWTGLWTVFKWIAYRYSSEVGWIKYNNMILRAVRALLVKIRHFLAEYDMQVALDKTVRMYGEGDTDIEWRYSKNKLLYISGVAATEAATRNISRFKQQLARLRFTFRFPQLSVIVKARFIEILVEYFPYYCLFTMVLSVHHNNRLKNFLNTARRLILVLRPCNNTWRASSAHFPGKSRCQASTKKTSLLGYYKRSSHFSYYEAPFDSPDSKRNLKEGLHKVMTKINQSGYQGSFWFYRPFMDKTVSDVNSSL